MEEATQTKWEGKVTAKLKASPEQAWPLLEDFCSLNKYLPSIDTCNQLEGVYGQPGLIRYCASTVASSSGETAIKWCHEKLLEMDPIQRCLTYEVLDNNMGFNLYVSTMKVLPINGDDEHGCQIEWSFVCDPNAEFKYDDLLTYIDFSVRSMAENIDKALQC